MEEAEVGGYWCHVCSERVNPIMEIDMLKCPLCEGGFVEEMTSSSDIEVGRGDGGLSLWAPILLGMLDNNPRRSTRHGHGDEHDDDDNDDDVEREVESIMRRRRRRRSSAAILQLLQSMRAGRDGERDGGVIFINPFNDTVILEGVSGNNGGSTSLGDYFMGPGLDLLLQHLSENDPNRYGTPPAEKEVVEALPTVKVEETVQCSVCLDECETGEQVKELPCKHKFHSNCILPWLNLHSSCPICRHLLPSQQDHHSDKLQQFLPWPFTNFFSSSTSSSSSSTTGNTSNANPTTSHSID